MNVWKLSTVTFAALFATTLAFNVVPTADADKQPKMRDALRALKSAAGHLQKATPDKGGHRVNAIRLTNEAIAEVEKGIAFDNTH